MINLDDSQTYRDSNGGDTVLTSVKSLPQQVKKSFEEALTVSFPDAYRTVKNVVVCGMGGSRFPALILKELFKQTLNVPYELNDNYTLPGYVGADTLVILSSYSGTTEEVIHCGKLAKEKGAKLAGIAAGGEVAAMLKELGAPVYVFNTDLNPSNQPRIGFGYSVGGHLGILVNLGLVSYEKSKIEDALNAFPALVSGFLPEVAEAQNPAKQLAREIVGHYPYYIVSEHLIGVGNAIANQTNETAKSISSFRVIPELNHHLMEGLKFPPEMKKIGLFVFFNSTLYSTPIQKRFKITKDVVEQNGLSTQWVDLKGTDRVQQVFEMMGLATFMTMYLSALYEQDATAIPFVDYFKAQLKQMA